MFRRCLITGGVLRILADGPLVKASILHRRSSCRAGVCYVYRQRIQSKRCAGEIFIKIFYNEQAPGLPCACSLYVSYGFPDHPPTTYSCLCLSVCLSVRPSVYLTPLCLLCLSICLLHLYIHLFFYLCVSGLSVLLYTYSLIYCAIYLCFSVVVSFCLPPTSLLIDLSICSSMWPFL